MYGVCVREALTAGERILLAAETDGEGAAHVQCSHHHQYEPPSSRGAAASSSSTHILLHSAVEVSKAAVEKIARPNRTRRSKIKDDGLVSMRMRLNLNNLSFYTKKYHTIVVTGVERR